MDNEEKESKKISRIIIILSIVIATISAYILLTQDLKDKPIAGKGSNINENVQIGGEFTLIDQNNNEFSSQKLQGKISLIYFGFSFCPDICPTSLDKLSKIISNLEKYGVDVLPIFISVDPERDNPKLLKEYISHFHPKIIALTGSKEDIEKVTKAYKVIYMKANNNNKADEYMIDHSSFIYLMNKQGKYYKHFYANDSAEDIIKYIMTNKDNL